jgi:uncharacterized protein YegL
VTDGAMDDAEIEQHLDDARSTGVDVVAMIQPTDDWDRDGQARWKRWVPEAADRFVGSSPARLEPLIDRITEWQTEDGLLLNASLQEPLAGNMRYVTGSAQPSAVYDAQAHLLRWTLDDLPAAGTTLRYHVEPQALGQWPKGPPATMEYLDLYGAFDHLGFPVPQVEVLPLPTAAPPAIVYLPFLLRGACKPSSRPLDIVLVLDVSGSMAEQAPDGRVKLEAAQEAARAFAINLQMPRDRVALVAFDAEARLALGLSGDEVAVGRALDALQTGAGTRIDLGLERALEVVSTQARSEAALAVILLTDGLHAGDPADVFMAAEKLKNTDGRVFTIGLGADVDEAMLRRIASSPERYLPSPTTAELRALYDRILLQIDCDTSTGG